jgi:hypothetical protein
VPVSPDPTVAVPLGVADADEVSADCADFISSENVPLFECCWKSLSEFDGSDGAFEPTAQMTPAEDDVISKLPEFCQDVALLNLIDALNVDEVKLLDSTVILGPE